MKKVVRVLLLLMLMSSTVDGHVISRSFVSCTISNYADRGMQSFFNRRNSPADEIITSAAGNIKTTVDDYYNLNHNKVKINKIHGIAPIKGKSYKIVESRLSYNIDEFGYYESVITGAERMSYEGSRDKEREFGNVVFGDNSLLEESLFNPFASTGEDIDNDSRPMRNGPMKIGKDDENQLVTPGYTPVGNAVKPLLIMIMLFLTVRILRIKLT